MTSSACKCWMQAVSDTVHTTAASDRAQADYDPVAAMASAERVCRRAAFAHLATSSQLLPHLRLPTAERMPCPIPEMHH